MMIETEAQGENHRFDLSGKVVEQIEDYLTGASLILVVSLNSSFVVPWAVQLAAEMGNSMNHDSDLRTDQ